MRKFITYSQGTALIAVILAASTVLATVYLEKKMVSCNFPGQARPTVPGVRVEVGSVDISPVDVSAVKMGELGSQMLKVNGCPILGNIQVNLSCGLHDVISVNVVPAEIKQRLVPVDKEVVMGPAFAAEALGGGTEALEVVRIAVDAETIEGTGVRVFEERYVVVPAVQSSENSDTVTTLVPRSEEDLIERNALALGVEALETESHGAEGQEEVRFTARQALFADLVINRSENGFGEVNGQLNLGVRETRDIEVGALPATAEINGLGAGAAPREVRIASRLEGVKLTPRPNGERTEFRLFGVQQARGPLYQLPGNRMVNQGGVLLRDVGSLNQPRVIGDVQVGDVRTGVPGVR